MFASCAYVAAVRGRSGTPLSWASGRFPQYLVLEFFFVLLKALKLIRRQVYLKW
jgi:hypothetical protein